MARIRKAFTFVELLVVLSVLGVGVYFAATGTSGQNSYYGLRGDVERIVSGIQRACIQSSSRGQMVHPAPRAPNTGITAGVTFWSQQMGPRFLPQAGFSFVNWFDDLAFNTEAAQQPTGGLGTATAQLQTASKALRQETQLMRQYQPGVPNPLRDGACLRYRQGRLDVFQLDGTIGGGILVNLNNDFTRVDSALGIGNPVAWTFDVVNPNVGWVRIRCLSGGFVEASGINPLNTAVPTNVVGGLF